MSPCKPKQETKVPCKDVFAVPYNEIVNIPLSLPARNASAYIAGYLLRKYPMTDCQQCQNKCKLIKMPENNALYKFLKEKTYTEVSGLTYPTVCMIIVCGGTGVIVFHLLLKQLLICPQSFVIFATVHRIFPRVWAVVMKCVLKTSRKKSNCTWELSYSAIWNSFMAKAAKTMSSEIVNSSNFSTCSKSNFQIYK